MDTILLAIFLYISAFSLITSIEILFWLEAKNNSKYKK